MNNIKTAYPGDPIERNITATRNDTFLYKFRGWASDGSPYDFTGHSFIMQVKEKRAEGETPVIDITNSEFTIDQDNIGSNASVQNVIIIEVPAADMNVEPGDYVYDIQMTDGAGKVQTIQKENEYFRVEQDVSQ